MNPIYQAIGFSKQSFHQKLDRYLSRQEEQQQLLFMVAQIRADHPGMSAREMYRLLAPQHIGRDRFIELCHENGYLIEVKKAFHRTTDSKGVIRFKNLIVDYKLTRVNQVWVSDITYYRISDQFYYLTFIMDLYSRYIVGYNVSEYLYTHETTIPALTMAINVRQPSPGLIHHSDAGGQYYCKEFLSLTLKYGIINSMCETVYENAHAERVNGTIKNYYLIHYAPENFIQLKTLTKKAVEKYNMYKPHKGLNHMTPAQYERLSTENEVINKRKKEPKKEKNTTSLKYNCNP